MTEPLGRIDLPGIPRCKSGKVREVFNVGEHLLIVATDRISAFDYVLPTLIPAKGKVLTQLSSFWFRETAAVVPNHFITDQCDEYPSLLKPFRELLAGRSMLVKKATVVPIECVVRGYISGSAWSEYERSGRVAGIAMPELVRSQKFPSPLFTPSTKAEAGHDENITFDEMKRVVGPNLAERLSKASLALYEYAHAYAVTKGLIIADTKFEFGLDDDEPMLVDEIFTPDSSRFWERSRYEPGKEQDSFDKQFVRNYLLSCGWDRNSPPPELPPDIVQRTVERYREAFFRLTGKELKDE